MEDYDFQEKSKRIEAAAKEALQGLEELKSMVARESEMISHTTLPKRTSLPQPVVPDSCFKTNQDSMRVVIDHEGNLSKVKMEPQSRHSKIKLWTKRVFKKINNDGKTNNHESSCSDSVDKITDKATSSTLKKSSWKLRSPVTRRGVPKENPAQSAEIEVLKQALKFHETAKPIEHPESGDVEGKKAETRRLEGHKSEITRLEEYKAEIRRLEEYRVAATRLAKEKMESQPKLQALAEENKSLKNEKQRLSEEKRRLEPLAEVGKAVRLRVFETYETETNAQSKADLVIIKNGNKAAHHGNIAADSALFYLKAIDRAKHAKAFDTIYRIGGPENYHGRYLVDKATELLNLRGTVELSVHYPDRSIYDKFISLEKKWRAYITVGGMSLSAINPDTEMKNAYLRLEELTAAICNKARKGKISGSIPRSAKEVGRRNQKDNKQPRTNEVEVIIPTGELVPTAESKSVVLVDEPKKRKRNKKKAVALLQSKDEALDNRVIDTVAKVSKEEETIKPQPPARIDIAQLGRVEVVVPGLFGMISNIFGYGG